MTCYSPMFGWRGKKTNEKTGKRPLVFKKSEALLYEDRETRVEFPCGNCDGCAIDKAREWALRCVNEAAMHERNCFITLTYNDDNLPMDGGLDMDDVQRFMKRLRQHNVREAKKMSKDLGRSIQPDKIRHYGAGEYGSTTGKRPHYHIALFNYDFDDKEIWSVRDDVPLYRSATLEKLWDKGYSTIGSLTVESACYIARYIGKKWSDKNNPRKYEVAADSETGEVLEVTPEFSFMSKKPGIGHSWFEKYKNDTRKGFIIVNGQRYPLPKYYRTLMEEYDKEQAKKDRRRRKRARKEAEKKGEFTIARLEQKEKVKQAQLKLLKRGAE